MTIRDPARQLAALGPLPSSDAADEEQIDRYGELLDQLLPPISREEAELLCALFRTDDDETYGLAWDLVHKIESCPDWPVAECLGGKGWWFEHLRTAVKNAKEAG